MRRLLKRLFSESPPEEILVYADTEIVSISSRSGTLILKGVDYSENPFVLRFTSAEVVADQTQDNSRIETGRVKKLTEERKRIVLQNDDREIILEIEYSKCEAVQPNP